MSISLGTPVGVHVLVNVYNIPNRDTLEYLSNGLPLLDEIVRELNLHVMTRAGHQFSPTGYTYAYVLSESHFTIHTYPEYQSCYIDIFCCNAEFQPTHAVHLIQQAFDTQTVRYQVIRR